MKVYVRACVFVFITLGLVMWGSESFAQFVQTPLDKVPLPSFFKDGTPKPVEPSQLTMPVPAPPPPPAKPVIKSNIPPLPLSNPCTPDDVTGFWKLKDVYEFPQGKETDSFIVSPIDYTWYMPDETYGRYKGNDPSVTPKIAGEQMRKHSTRLLQYLVQDSGLIYYYQDKVANYVQSCFIVFADKGPFFKGDMLLMPPKGQIAGRLIKQYAKIWGPKPKVQNKQVPQINNRPAMGR